MTVLQVLSRAFRNRFIELHCEDIPSKELATILHQCCALPQTYADKMVAVMRELQVNARHPTVPGYLVAVFVAMAFPLWGVRGEVWSDHSERLVPVGSSLQTVQWAGTFL